MLLLHAADLHLGKTLHERDLGPDQAAMLDGLLATLAERRPAALLLAGDLYDRSIPPPEAVTLFDSFLSRAALADPGLTIVAISGNHDSAARLSFGTSIMSRSGVHIRTQAADCVRPVLVRRDGEAAAIWPLPFLGAGAFAPEAGLSGPADAAPAEAADPARRGGEQGELNFGDPKGAAAKEGGAAPGPRSQAELFAEAMRRIAPLLRPDSYNVLLAHCFATGGSSSESERCFVGFAEEVDSSAFEPFDYAALGHLHRFQRAGGKGRYSGSPLAYSFAEGGEAKGFVLVELRRGGFEAELLPHRPLRAMRRVEGPFSVLSAPGAYPECREDFVEALLTDPGPVLNPADPLRANFPNLLSVRQAAFELAPGPRAADARPVAAARPIAEEFAAFHAEMRGEPPDEETAALFAALAKEAADAAL
jgi:DNA repair protein SbcD/Mre11